MDLRYFEHDFRESVLHQAIKWVKAQQIRKLPHEYAVGEFRVKIKTNAHALVHASCSCNKVKCAHLAAVLLYRQGHSYDILGVKNRKAQLFDKQVLQYKRGESSGKVIHPPQGNDLVKQLAWLCVHFQSESYIDEVLALWQALNKKRYAEIHQEIWLDAAVYSLKRPAILSDLVSQLFPICIRNIRNERMLEELADKLRGINRRRFDAIRSFLLELIIQQRLQVSGKMVTPSHAHAAIAWCKLQAPHSTNKVLQQCKLWITWPMEGRLQFAWFCRENFSEYPEMVQLTYYAELVAAPMIRRELWETWYKGVPDDLKSSMVDDYLKAVEQQPYLVRVTKRLFVFVQQKNWQELARELRRPEVTFSMAHEALSQEALGVVEVRKVYEKLVGQAILWSSGALKKLIQQKAEERLMPLDA